MRLFLVRWIFCFLVLGSWQSFAKPFSSSIEGPWETIDDKTGQKKALVLLHQNQGVLEGQIQKVYWQPGQNQRCIHCQGLEKNQAIEGMRFLWGLHQESSHQWTGGYILDPHNGKIYRVNLTEDKDKLLVRAYLGFSLIGRTQVWHRYHGGSE